MHFHFAHDFGALQVPPRSVISIISSSAARGLAPELTPVPLVVGNSASEVTLASLIDFAFEYQEKILMPKNVAIQNKFILD